MVLTQAIKIEPVISTTSTWHPAQPHTMNAVTFLGGERQEQLVSVIGQYNSAEKTERLYDEMTFLLHWSESDDWTPPLTPTVRAIYHDNAIAFSVETGDDTGVYRVLATYTHNDGLWQSQDLTKTGAIWTGSIPAYPETEFFIQAVDKVGNAAVNDNAGDYHVAATELVYLPLVLRY